MNEIFNPRRFCAYAVRSWRLYAKKYLVHAGIFAGIMVLFIVLVCAFDDGQIFYGDLNSITPWYTILTIAFFATFPMVVMKPFKSRHTLTMENTVPVSTTEKWLFVLLNTTVVAAILCGVALSLTVLTGMAITGSEPFAEYFRYAMNKVPKEVYLIFTFALFITQAVVMFAGTQERRNHRVSVLLIGITGLAAMLTLAIFPMWLSDKLDMAVQFGPIFSFAHAKIESQLSMVEYFSGMTFQGPGEQLLWGAGIAVVLLFWLAAWLNFRERSIK